MISGRRGAPHDHVCWSYDDPAAFDVEARHYLAGGLAAGEQVWFVVPGRTETARKRLAGLPRLDEALRRGAARIVPADTTYAGSGFVDPAGQVRAYAEATASALAAGYTGLRVVAEATDLVMTLEQRDLFARYEHLVDRWMRVHPFSAMCAYDRGRLGDAATAELACLHPRGNRREVSFRLSACGPEGDRATLAGELDSSSHELFATALDRADLRPVDGELRFHASELRFIDHRCLLHLQRYAHRRGATAVLHTALPAAARLVEMMALADVRVEAA